MAAVLWGVSVSQATASVAAPPATKDTSQRASRDTPPTLRVSARSREKMVPERRQARVFKPIRRRDLRGELPRVSTDGAGAQQQPPLTPTAYLEALNAIEAKLAAQGYSLRDPAPERISLYHPDRALLAEQAKRNAANAVPPRGGVRPTLDSLRVEQNATRETRERALRPKPGAGPGSLQPQAIEKRWGFEYGDPDLLAGFFDLAFRAEGAWVVPNPHVEADGHAAAGFSLMGHRVELASLDGRFKAGTDGKHSAIVTWRWLQQEHLLLDAHSVRPSLNASAGVDLPVRAWERQFPLPVPGIDIQLVVAVTPEAHVGYDVSTDDGSLVVEIRPRLLVTATAEVSVDVKVVEAGISGVIYILDARPQITASVALRESNSGRDVVIKGVVHNELTLLRGEIEGFVDPVFWPRKSFVLIESDGLSYSDDLFAEY